MNRPGGKDPFWHGMMTLGPGDPDTNRRTLCFGFRVVAEFNHEMSVWTDRDERHFEALIWGLNKIGALIPERTSIYGTHDFSNDAINCRSCGVARLGVEDNIVSPRCGCARQGIEND